MIGRLGVKFKMNRRLGGNLSLDELKKESDAIFLAIGAWKDVALNIPGEHAKGVFAGSDVLKEMSMGKIPQIGQQIVIVGAGNVAVDASRSLLRLGKEVILVYRREKKDMPAN
ncbi:MAG TPA: hypothetical protein DCS09_03130, partial [Porphyromonadaceae bacterium]|nr:hypothetical protein [Porphyromonadaceae bacterium]